MTVGAPTARAGVTREKARITGYTNSERARGRHTRPAARFATSKDLFLFHTHSTQIVRKCASIEAGARGGALCVTGTGTCGFRRNRGVNRRRQAAPRGLCARGHRASTSNSSAHASAFCSSPSRHAEPRLEARLGTSVLWWPMPLVCSGAHTGGECKWGLAELASASNGAIRKWTNLQSFFERKLRILQRVNCWSDGGAR